jgi:hypothetical protein
MLIPLTRVKGSSGLTTLNIEYIDDLPEYPTTHLHGHTYVVASQGRTQLEMENIPEGVSGYLVLDKWLLSTSRFNTQNDSLLDESDLFTVHFLDAKLRNGHGNALGSMHVNFLAHSYSLIIIYLLMKVLGKKSKSLREMPRS